MVDKSISNFNTVNILIVDDSNTNRKIIRRILDAQPHILPRLNIVDCCRASEVDNLSTLIHDFDCIIVDSAMPDMNGPTLVSKLRLTYGYQNIIIGISGDIANSMADSFAAAGTDWVCCRPFTTKNFISNLLTCLMNGSSLKIVSEEPYSESLSVDPYDLKIEEISIICDSTFPAPNIATEVLPTANEDLVTPNHVKQWPHYNQDLNDDLTGSQLSSSGTHADDLDLVSNNSDADVDHIMTGKSKPTKVNSAWTDSIDSHRYRVRWSKFSQQYASQVQQQQQYIQRLVNMEHRSSHTQSAQDDAEYVRTNSVVVLPPLKLTHKAKQCPDRTRKHCSWNGLYSADSINHFYSQFRRVYETITEHGEYSNEFEVDVENNKFSISNIDHTHAFKDCLQAATPDVALPAIADKSFINTNQHNFPVDMTDEGIDSSRPPTSVLPFKERLADMLRFSSYSASIKCDSDSADNKLTKSPNSSAGSPLPTPVVLDDVGVGHPMDSFIESSKVNENCNDRETLAPPISSSSTLASTPEHAPMLSPVKRTLPLSDISPRSMLKDPDSMTALARVIQRVTEERLGLCKEPTQQLPRVRVMAGFRPYKSKSLFEALRAIRIQQDRNMIDQSHANNASYRLDFELGRSSSVTALDCNTNLRNNSIQVQTVGNRDTNDCCNHSAITDTDSIISTIKNSNRMLLHNPLLINMDVPGSPPVPESADGNDNFESNRNAISTVVKCTPFRINNDNHKFDKIKSQCKTLNEIVLTGQCILLGNFALAQPFASYQQQSTGPVSVTRRSPHILRTDRELLEHLSHLEYGYYYRTNIFRAMSASSSTHHSVNGNQIKMPTQQDGRLHTQRGFGQPLSVYGDSYLTSELDSNSELDTEGDVDISSTARQYQFEISQLTSRTDIDIPDPNKKPSFEVECIDSSDVRQEMCIPLDAAGEDELQQELEDYLAELRASSPRQHNDAYKNSTSFKSTLQLKKSLEINQYLKMFNADFQAVSDKRKRDRERERNCVNKLLHAAITSQPSHSVIHPYPLRPPSVIVQKALHTNKDKRRMLESRSNLDLENLGIVASGFGSNKM